MSLALVAALALSPTAAACSWDRPGVDPFMGNVPAAVDRYTDIPVEVRQRLKSRMVKRQYDEIATIRRDSISGRHRYDSAIRDMHFGQGRVCRTVTRERWAADTVERGLVYCEAEHCIIVPTVCRNVSRVTRLPGTPVAAPGGEGSLPGVLIAGPQDPLLVDAGLPTLALADPNAGELVFDPPGAGNSFAQDSQPLQALGSIPGTGGGGSALPSTVGGVTGLPVLPGLGGAPVPGGGGSALEVPPGVAPIGSGSVGGGGLLPPIVNPSPILPAPVPEVPEPSTWLLWAAGLMGVAWIRRRQRV